MGGEKSEELWHQELPNNQKLPSHRSNVDVTFRRRRTVHERSGTGAAEMLRVLTLKFYASLPFWIAITVCHGPYLNPNSTLHPYTRKPNPELCRP